MENNNARISFAPQEGDSMLQMLLNTSLAQRAKLEWTMMCNLSAEIFNVSKICLEQGASEELTKKATDLVNELYMHILSLSPTPIISQTQNFTIPNSDPFFSQTTTLPPLANSYQYQPYENTTNEAFENKTETSVISTTKQQDPATSIKEKRRPSFSKLIEKGASTKFLKAMNRNRRQRKGKSVKSRDKERTCGWCNTQETPEWRNGPGSMTLCNACGLQYRNSLKQEEEQRKKNSIQSVLN